MTRLPDHDLEVLVDTAAEGAWNAKAAHTGGPLFAALERGKRNEIREAALPFIFHGTKALAELGYVKPRIVTTVKELDALLQGDANVALMDEDGMILQNLAGGWATPISTRFMTSETVHRGFGPGFTVLHEGSTS